MQLSIQEPGMFQVSITTIETRFLVLALVGADGKEPTSMREPLNQALLVSNQESHIFLTMVTTYGHTQTAMPDLIRHPSVAELYFAFHIGF